MGMHYFQYQGDDLYCDGVAVEAIASDVGTPFYLYSQKTLERHYKVFDAAFDQIPHITCFSAKANSNIAVLRVFARYGAGVDVVSGGEIFRALLAGIPPKKIVYSGVGKTPQEIEYAMDAGILMFHVESEQELEVISNIASKTGKRASIALRVNPDIDPRTHPYISTGLKENKFGINIKDALQVCKNVIRSTGLDIIGIACHIGSQITEVSPFTDSMHKIKELARQLLSEGIEIKYLDLGGGLGITYEKETPPQPEQYAQALIKDMEGLPYTLILEPGRVIVGNAGILVSKVLYTKTTEEKHIIIIDAAMNDLIRPSLYGSFQDIWPVKKKHQDSIRADIVGPICESGDFMAKGREVPKFVPGDYIAIMSAGAYGFTMSSNYNSRLRIPEVLVHAENHFVIRERESYEDLIKNEKIPRYLQ
jgi:diaminopimelate decarboxylase